MKENNSIKAACKTVLRIKKPRVQMVRLSSHFIYKRKTSTTSNSDRWLLGLIKPIFSLVHSASKSIIQFDPARLRVQLYAFVLLHNHKQEKQSRRVGITIFARWREIFISVQIWWNTCICLLFLLLREYPAKYCIISSKLKEKCKNALPFLNFLTQLIDRIIKCTYVA